MKIKNKYARLAVAGGAGFTAFVGVSVLTAGVLAKIPTSTTLRAVTLVTGLGVRFVATMVTVEYTHDRLTPVDEKSTFRRRTDQPDLSNTVV